MEKFEILLYSVPEGKATIEVFFEEETFWLSQKKMAELFNVTVKTISEHLQNIFTTSELNKDSVIRNFRTTAADGKYRHRIERGGARRSVRRGRRRSGSGVGGIGIDGGGVFHVTHNLCKSFIGAREDRPKRPKLGARLKPAPFKVFKFAATCGNFDVAQSKLRPDLQQGLHAVRAGSRANLS